MKSLFGINMVVKGGGPEVDRARKEVISIFLKEDLKLTTECNSKCVGHLHVQPVHSADEEPLHDQPLQPRAEHYQTVHPVDGETLHDKPLAQNLYW